jgi:catechol 2,3-dioxygenase-like lactoylglutathione lyase family enzyme
MIDHVGFEVSDLRATTRFYDPIFHALGARRVHDAEQAVAYGINGPMVWFVARGLGPGPAYGHVALQATGKAAVDAAYAAGLAHGGTETVPPSPPGQRPQYGRRYYAGYLADPDGLRVEIVSRR